MRWIKSIPFAVFLLAGSVSLVGCGTDASPNGSPAPAGARSESTDRVEKHKLKREIAKLEGEIRDLDRDYQRLHRRLSYDVHKRRSLARQLDNLRFFELSKRDKIREEIAEIHQQLSHLEAEMKENRSQRAKKESRVEELRARLGGATPASESARG